MRQRDLHVAVRDVVGPAEHTVPALALRERRQLEAFHQLVDVLPVRGVDHRADLLHDVVGRGAVHVDRLLRHHRVDAVRLAVDVLVDPVELDLELLGAEADGAEHAEPAGLAHRGDDVAAVREREDRVLDPEHVTQWGSHGVGLLWVYWRATYSGERAGVLVEPVAR